MIMNFKNIGLAAVGATAISAFSASESMAEVIDLGFIIDESGSVGQTNYEGSISALRNAISQVPLSDGTTTYRVGVVSFGSGAATVATPVAFDSAANKTSVLNALLDESSRADGGSLAYNVPFGITDATNYVAAFDKLSGDFSGAFGSLGDTSVANMTTDGGFNEGGDPTQRANDLRNVDGWDSLSFEAVANTSVSDENFLAGIGFDTTGIGGCNITNDASTLSDVVNDCFVIDVPSFAAYEEAVLSKVAQTVIDTGGNIQTGVIPLPAGLPLLLTGLAAFLGMRGIRAKA